MSKADKTLSIKLYQYLCNVVGSEEVVNTRRKIFCSIDSFCRNSSYIIVSSGSKAEGIDFIGSDYDQNDCLSILSCTVCQFCRVYDSTNNVSTFTDEIPIIMDINDTKPEFTKLRLYDMSDLPDTYLFCEIKEGDAYFSSKLYREYGLIDDYVIHGPCTSTANGTHDFANSFRCKEWIRPAQHWIHRSRSSWPDNNLVTSVVQYGVLFVPIGCKGSANEDLEWRISFSMAEKQLIFSFSHTQLLCYALLKIILKDIIKTKHSDLICSYFLKTIMFWLCEESNPSDWNPANMIPCFMNCLRRLIYCVQYKTCLHYFIPENNLFEGRFTDYQHRSLLDKLHDIYHSLWTCVFNTATFQRFIIEHKLTNMLSGAPILTASAFACLSYTKCSFSPVFPIHIALLRKIKDKELSAYMMSQVFNELLQLPDRYQFTESNKSVYEQYQISLNCFKAGIHFNVTATWLLLASLYYKYRRFHECIDIINYSLSKCTPDKILLHLDKTFKDQTYFQQMRKSVGFLSTCKHLVVENVWFRPPFTLLPVELTPLIESVVHAKFIPAVVYLNSLTFLCSYHLEDIRGLHTALRNLELTIRDKYFIIPNEPNLKIANQCLYLVKNMM
ncbi:cyclic GMP-AMP synthase [Mytilus galloprovincialis]|uniref:Cyclic GMP-AMP synthase n=1 Tax=Mytilus galloprovincialis TaxID=29158 RepID=A0A8B6C8F2_MYTGA|nr:cyclic GMP-AMP synthase [Mytilus galloprovincialis]